MRTKTNVLVFSLAAILALSVVAMGEIPQAEADKDQPKKLKFKKKPDFVSDTCIVTSYATNLPIENYNELDCKMQAWLDKKANGLKYEIQIIGMELIDSNASTQDDLYQLHIHKNTLGTPENPKGPHVLDVYRAPQFGDADLVVLPVQGELRGIWDDGDHDPLTDENNLERLCNSEIFAAGHGDFIDDTPPGHHAPYIKMLLEPTKEGDKVCKKLGF